MNRKVGPFVELGFSWVPAIDSEVPEVVFNPCGHLSSRSAAEFWSQMALPNNAPPNALYRPMCPYCAKPLCRRAGERPFCKIIFQT
jgi:pellino